MSVTLSKDNWLNLNAEKLLTIWEMSSDGILITDSSANIIFCNNAMSIIDGLSPEEILGKKTTDKMTFMTLK